MVKIDDILLNMKWDPKNERFHDLCKIFDHYFGEVHRLSGSHRIYRTPWQGDPRINIQNSKGKDEAYQIKQVLLAIDKSEDDHAFEK